MEIGMPLLMTTAHFRSDETETERYQRNQMR